MNLDAYKKRLAGRNTAEAMERDTTKLVKRTFKDSKAYNRAILIDYNLDEIPIDIRMVNIDKSVYKKKFYLMPGQVAKVGNYIKIETVRFPIHGSRIVDKTCFTYGLRNNRTIYLILCNSQIHCIICGHTQPYCLSSIFTNRRSYF